MAAPPLEPSEVHWPRPQTGTRVSGRRGGEWPSAWGSGAQHPLPPGGGGVVSFHGARRKTLAVHWSSAAPKRCLAPFPEPFDSQSHPGPQAEEKPCSAVSSITGSRVAQGVLPPPCQPPSLDWMPGPPPQSLSAQQVGPGCAIPHDMRHRGRGQGMAQRGHCGPPAPPSLADRGAGPGRSGGRGGRGGRAPRASLKEPYFKPYRTNVRSPLVVTQVGSVFS